jgi:hypothetical protein
MIGIPLGNLLMLGCEGLAGALLNFIGKAEMMKDKVTALAVLRTMIRGLIRGSMTPGDFLDRARVEFKCVYPENYVEHFPAHVAYFHAGWKAKWKEGMKKKTLFHTKRLRIPVKRLV